MNDLITLRIPPHSDEAETAFICAVLERNSLVDDVESILTPESFYRRENQLIFRRMRAMALMLHPIDLVTLANAMDAAGEYDDNMAQYLYDIAGLSRGAANAIHYATAWLKVNNNDIANSSTIFTIPARKSASPGEEGYLSAYSEATFTVQVGDEIKLYWATDLAGNPTTPTNGVYMFHDAAQVSPFARPAIPSAIGSITYVSAIPPA